MCSILTLYLCVESPKTTCSTMLAVKDSGRPCGWRCGHLLSGRFFGERVARLAKLAASALFAFSDHVAVDECVSTKCVAV